MESKYSYSFLSSARQDLRNILHYISIELDNRQAAMNLKSKIREKIELARQFPEMGALVENEYITKVTFRKLSAGNYLIYYNVDHTKKKIYIARIVYEKRDMDEIFKQS